MWAVHVIVSTITKVLLIGVGYTGQFFGSCSPMTYYYHMYVKKTNQNFVKIIFLDHQQSYKNHFLYGSSVLFWFYHFLSKK